MLLRIGIDKVTQSTKPSDEQVPKIKARMTENLAELTTEQLIAAIKNGQTFCPAEIAPITNSYGTLSHSARGWRSQQLFCVDIDNADSNHQKLIDDRYIPVDKALEICRTNGIEPFFVYRSFSYAENFEKFRICILTDSLITLENERERIVKAIISLFGEAADKSCKNADRIFFGSTPDCELYRKDDAVTSKTVLLQLSDRLLPLPKHSSPIADYQPQTVDNSSREWYKAFDFDINRLLYCCDPNDAYSNWISVTAAYKGAGGDVSIWQQWSMQSPKWRDSDARRWSGINGTSRSSLIALANQTAAGTAYIQSMKQAQSDAKEQYKQRKQKRNEPKPQGREKPRTLADFGAYRIVDLTDEEKQPPEFIVENMIPIGMTVLSGAPKTRKSFLALQMAIAVTNGNTFLGYRTNKVKAVYFDLEGSKSRISSRTEQIDRNELQNLYIINQTTASLGNRTLCTMILDIITVDPKIRLFVIDTYSRARGKVSTNGANAYDVDVDLLKDVQQLALDRKIAVIFIHHAKKGADKVSDSFERASGTMGITGSADSVINLIADGKRSESKAHLEFTPRDDKGGDLDLEFNEHTLTWNSVTSPNEDYKNSSIIRWIIGNAPEPTQAAKFLSYKEIFDATCSGEYKLNAIKPVIEQYAEDVYNSEHVAIQIGAIGMKKLNGIRIIKL